ncbi:Si dkey-21a6.5 [Rhizoctonia solani]|uniref:Si dkey-21a6.5 n=1 Tax=Rhizoctonia solani TaxID=456999 RepID=A0A8H7IIY9_9AGAM|nr:Si dkey-21a6.5 [Rhizoctonia solani]
MRSVSLLAGAILCFSTQAVAGFSFEDVPNGTIGATTLFARANSCPSGQYYDNGCKQCPAGSYCTGEGGARQCDKGQYSRAGASACTACPSGTYTDPFNVRLPNVGGMPLGPTKATIEGRMDKNNVGEGFIAHQAAQLVKNVQPGPIAIPQRHASPLCANLGDSRPMKVPATVQSVLQGHTLTGMDRHLVANAAPGASKVLPGRPTARPAQNKHDSTVSHAYGLGDPSTYPGACVDSSVTENQAVCPATTGPVPTGLRKRTVPRGCSNRRHTMCEVKSGRGGWECLDTETTLDACGSCDNDCSAIPYVGDVKCVAGKCQVATCLKGFNVQYVDETPSCIPTTKQAFLIFERDMGLAK